MAKKQDSATLGQLAYEAWCAEIGSVALQPWADLGEPVRQAWYASSVALVEFVWKAQHREIVKQWKAQ